MEVYVLIGHILYESNELLGVYHTEADAEFAGDEYDRENKPFAGDEYDRENEPFDYYSIQRRVIGAKAK